MPRKRILAHDAAALPRTMRGSTVTKKNREDAKEGKRRCFKCGVLGAKGYKPPEEFGEGASGSGGGPFIFLFCDGCRPAGWSVPSPGVSVKDFEPSPWPSW